MTPARMVSPAIANAPSSDRTISQKVSSNVRTITHLYGKYGDKRMGTDTLTC